MGYFAGLFFITTLLTSFVPLPIPAALKDPRLYLLFFILTLLIRYKNKVFQDTHEKAYVVASCAFVFLSVLSLKYWQWMAAVPSGSDFGHYDYALWNWAQGNGLVVSVMKPQYYTNLMGNHFAPILYVLGLPYFLIESHFWLMSTQAIAAVLTFFIGYHLALLIFQRTGQAWARTGAGLMALALIFNPYWIRIVKFEFHPEIFFVPGFLYFILSMEKLSSDWNKKWLTHLMLATLVSLSVKEDASLYLFSISAVYLFSQNIRIKKLAVAQLAVWPILFLLTGKAMSLFVVDGTQSSFIGLWGRYGTTMTEIVTSFITKPHWVVRDIFSAKEFYKLLIPWLFLPLIGWQALALVIPAVVTFTSDGVIRDLSIYYSSAFLAALYMGTLYFLAKKPNFKAVVLIFSLNSVMGLGTYGLPLPHPTLGSQKNVANKYINEFEGRIWISDQLLAQVSYSSKLKRLSEYTFDEGLLIVSKDLIGHPMTRQSQNQLLTDLGAGGIILHYEDQQIVVYERKDRQL